MSEKFLGPGSSATSSSRDPCLPISLLEIRHIVRERAYEFIVTSEKFLGVLAEIQVCRYLCLTQGLFDGRSGT
jgi:hypothetical protein